MNLTNSELSGDKERERERERSEGYAYKKQRSRESLISFNDERARASRF